MQRASRAYIFFVVALLLLSFPQCKKGHEPLPPPTTISVDTDRTSLSDDSYQVMLDIQDAVRYSLKDVVLPDGEPVLGVDEQEIGKKSETAVSLNSVLDGAQTKKDQLDLYNDIVKEIIKEGQNLSSETKWAKPDEGINKPAQSKVGYVFGGRQLVNRSAPSAGICKDLLYGVDCSGFIGLLFNRRGMSGFDAKADVLSDVNKISKCIQPTLKPTFFEVADLNFGYDKKLFKSGDIVAFYYKGSIHAEHLGVIGAANGNLEPIFYHSFGNKSSCDRNNSYEGGPVSWSFSKIPRGLRRDGDLKYKIFRIRYRATLERINNILNASPGATNTIQARVVSSDGLIKVNFPVKFQTSDGTVNAESATNDKGVAEAKWTLDKDRGSGTCIASILSPVDNATVLDTIHFVIPASQCGTSSHTSVEECGWYTWVDGDGQTYSHSGAYTYVKPISSVCADTMVLDLTIKQDCKYDTCIVTWDFTDEVMGKGGIAVSGAYNRSGSIKIINQLGSDMKYEQAGPDCNGKPQVPAELGRITGYQLLIALPHGTSDTLFIDCIPPCDKPTFSIYKVVQCN